MTTTDDQLARAEQALQLYGLSEGGWRRTPSENLQELLVDLLRWCDATQHGFDRQLDAARKRHGVTGPVPPSTPGRGRCSGAPR